MSVCRSVCVCTRARSCVCVCVYTYIIYNNSRLANIGTWRVSVCSYSSSLSVPLPLFSSSLSFLSVNESRRSVVWTFEHGYDRVRQLRCDSERFRESDGVPFLPSLPSTTLLFLQLVVPIKIRTPTSSPPTRSLFSLSLSCSSPSSSIFATPSQERRMSTIATTRKYEGGGEGFKFEPRKDICANVSPESPSPPRRVSLSLNWGESSGISKSLQE